MRVLALLYNEVDNGGGNSWSRGRGHLRSKLFSESGPESQSWNPFTLSKGGQAANISPPGKWSVSLEPLDEDHDF